MLGAADVELPVDAAANSLINRYNAGHFASFRTALHLHCFCLPSSILAHVLRSPCIFCPKKVPDASFIGSC